MAFYDSLAKAPWKLWHTPTRKPIWPTGGMVVFPVQL